MNSDPPNMKGMIQEFEVEIRNFCKTTGMRCKICSAMINVEYKWHLVSRIPIQIKKACPTSACDKFK